MAVMDDHLLREYIGAILEKIRTVPDAERFDMRVFRGLADDDINRFGHMQRADDYISSRLESLGSGSSREAFLLNSRQVIKLAYNEKGRAQNEAELDVYTTPGARPILARIYDFDGRYFNWLISELVRPIETDSEFKRLTGIDFAEITDINYNYLKNVDMNHPLNQALMALKKETDLDPRDLSYPGHWGKTPDGRVVILDYGFTYSVARNHYDFV